MAQIITDDFNRANSGSLGANWTNNTGNGFQISSNQAGSVAVTGSDDLSVYSGAAWTGGNDQYAEVAIVTKASGLDASIVVRGATGGYFFEINDNDAAVALGSSMRCGMYKVVGTAFTLLGSNSSFTVSANDVIRVEAQGTSITAKLNGVTKFGPTSDSGIASGKPGLDAGGNPSANGVIFDNFAAGDFTTVSSAAPMMRPATMQFRAAGGALLVSRIAARILPQPNSVVFVQGSGAAVCRVTCSGTITGTGAVGGAAVVRVTGNGTVTGAGALSGAAVARVTATGTASGTGSLSGAAVARATAAGTVTGTGAVSGAALARVTAAGTVTGAGALSGAALARVTASATVAGLGALSGAALCRVTATGTIGTGGLTGAAVVLVLARGTVTGAGALTGTALCRVTAQGTVTNGAAVGTEVSYAWAT